MREEAKEDADRDVSEPLEPLAQREGQAAQELRLRPDVAPGAGPKRLVVEQGPEACSGTGWGG